MKFLALISGGKDSIFNIIRCIQEGHELVLLINLYPQEQGKESDSYMYQTVGTNMAEAIAQAMEKPIMRRQIIGKAKIQTLQYEDEQQGDEVEDLFQVLQQALQQYPDIKGVSSGAIASTYQKLRVENWYGNQFQWLYSCKRLGLESLAYLWNQDQEQLLKQMLQNQMDILIIKVAAFGLNEKHLGKKIHELFEYFMKIHKEHGFHPCGEGGEFESLVLDCPLYKKKIQIDEFEVVRHDSDPIAPVCYMLIKKYSLVDKL